MNLSSSFSPHNDVLNASPDTKSEKLSLIEELKRRGRSSVITKRYPDAKDLYSKAIDTFNTLLKQEEKDGDNSSNNTKKELAILFSNRSLCHLQMSQTQDAYNDALNATCHDQTYLKGFWRLGQSCIALKNTEEALIAYEKAYALDGNNKALEKECEKVKKQLEVEKVKKQQEAEEKEKRKEEEKIKEKEKVEKKANGKSTTKSTKPISSTLASRPTSTSTVSSSNSSSKEEKTTISSSKEFTTSDHVRGYKIVNGKKTSFFHHEQTEEEKRLIGDITPKRIDVTTEPQTAGPTKIENNNDNNKGGIKTSVWNTAGTWEEKDFTDWAIDSLKDQIMKCNYHLPDGSPDPKAHVQVTKITKLLSSKVAGGTCHASVATVRGKKKYIFEFNVCVHWEMTLGDGRKCRGEMTFLDVDGTHEIGEGYDISDYNVDNETPSDAKYLLERFVRDGGLRTTIEKAMDDWIGIFRDTH